MKVDRPPMLREQRRRLRPMRDERQGETTLWRAPDAELTVRPTGDRLHIVAAGVPVFELLPVLPYSAFRRATRVNGGTSSMEITPEGA